MTDCCPVASRDGHNLPGLVDEYVPSVAAMVNDIVEGFDEVLKATQASAPCAGYSRGFFAALGIENNDVKFLTMKR